MRERFNKWLDTPITWRASFKSAGIAVIFGMIFNAVIWMYLCWEDIVEWYNKKFHKVEKNEENE
jgi:hypothetical protein